MSEQAEHAGRQGEGVPGGAVIGHFNLNSDWRLEGWCCWPDRPGERPQVEITVNGRVVSSCVAVQLNDTLRQSGIGDGRYGFSLAPPAQIGTAANGEAIVEARERRTGTVLGRVIFHAERGVADRARHLDWLAGRTQALFDAVLERQDTRLQAVGGAFQRLGQELLRQQHGRAIGQAHDASRGMARVRAEMARAPAVRLGYSAAPDLSLIFLGGTDWRETVGAVRHAVTALAGLQLEIALVTDGSDAAHLLLPLCIPYLRLILHAGPADLVRALNDAAVSARGTVLCLVEDAAAFNVQGIAQSVRDGSVAVFGGSAARALRDSPQGQLVAAWSTPRLQDGAALLVARGDLLAAGGLAASADGRGVAWGDLAAVLAALEVPIEGRTVARALAG